MTYHETEVGHSMVGVEDIVPAEGSKCLGVVVGAVPVVVGRIAPVVVVVGIVDRTVGGFAAVGSH